MSGNTLAKNFLNVISKQKAPFAIIAMFILMFFFDTNFYTSYNLLGMLNTASVNVVLVAGVTLVIISGGCDLSIGGMLSLSGIVVIQLMNFMPIPFAILCSLALGALVGLINGFLVVHQKVEPFIITLGMGMVLKGVCEQITDARPINPSNLEFMKIANFKFLSFKPTLIIVMVVVLLAVYILLRFTKYGRNCYAVGGDYEVAVYAGINARRTKWVSYVICGATAALGGIMLSSKLNSGSSIYGDTTALIVHCESKKTYKRLENPAPPSY